MNKVLFTWWDLRQDLHSLAKQSFVVTLTQQTHGAFGAIAFGIGTSEVEHVFATQTLWQTKPKNLKIDINGTYQQASMLRTLFCI